MKGNSVRFIEPSHLQHQQQQSKNTLVRTMHRVIKQSSSGTLHRSLLPKQPTFELEMKKSLMMSMLSLLSCPRASKSSSSSRSRKSSSSSSSSKWY